MNINISVKRKFKINNKEFNSIEEMPEDIREAFNKVMDSQIGSGHRISSTVAGSKVIFNGKEYEKVDAMPQEVRQLYENVLKAAESGAPSSGVDIAGISGGMVGKPETISAARPGEIRKPIKVEFVFSPRTLMGSAALIVLIFLLYYLFQNG
jgi:hypothetical protein